MDPADEPTEPRPLDDATRAAEASEARADHRADRPPTPDEERRADEQAADVPPTVAEHAREMTELGAHVQGEGRAEP